MARASKAAGSPGKCASCGKGLPKSMKSAMTRCPHCGKALKTDSSAIKEGLPPRVERAALHLQEALDAREAALRGSPLVTARAVVDVRAGQLLGALVEAAATYHVGSFEGLHPRDRLGRFMEKLSEQVRHAVAAVKEADRKAVIQAEARNLATAGGLLPLYTEKQFLARHGGALREADIGTALAETEMLMASARRIEELGQTGQNFERVHPRDRVGKFMEKVGGGTQGRVGVVRTSTSRPDPDPKRFVDKTPATKPAPQHRGTLKGDDGNTGTPRGHGRPTYHNDLAPAPPQRGEEPPNIGKPGGAVWDTDESYRRFFAENKRAGHPPEKLTRGDFQRVMQNFQAFDQRRTASAVAAAKQHKAKQEGAGGHDQRRHGGSAPPAETRHKGYVIKRNAGGSYDVLKDGEHVSERASHVSVDAAKRFVDRIAGGQRSRRRMLREDQVRLLVEAGTAESADDAHALLDRMGA
jgi:predicted RNA-binding Zn-ribbon protein involved in translation (DUF1610 family)